MIFEGVSDGRRRNMQANRSKNTKPEIEIRQMLHALGYRFRIHGKDLPGRPDVVFRARRRVVDIRGCFWHGHGCHPLGLLPKTRREYWDPKISGNRVRDDRNAAALKAQGWEALVLWECQVRSDRDGIKRDLVSFLGPARLPGTRPKTGSNS